MKIPKLSTLSILCLSLCVLSFVWTPFLAIPAIICGHIALRQKRRSPEMRKDLLTIISIVIAYLQVLAIAAPTTMSVWNKVSERVPSQRDFESALSSVKLKHEGGTVFLEDSMGQRLVIQIELLPEGSHETTRPEKYSLVVTCDDIADVVAPKKPESSLTVSFAPETIERSQQKVDYVMTPDFQEAISTLVDWSIKMPETGENFLSRRISEKGGSHFSFRADLSKNQYTLTQIDLPGDPRAMQYGNFGKIYPITDYFRAHLWKSVAVFHDAIKDIADAHLTEQRAISDELIQSRKERKAKRRKEREKAKRRQREKDQRLEELMPQRK